MLKNTLPQVLAVLLKFCNSHEIDVMFRIAILALLSFSGICAQAQKRNAANALVTAAGERSAAGGFNKGDNSFRIVTAKKVMEIKIPEGGANGASVVYHPKEKLYYAAQAGNASFPLVIFDESGTVVSPPEQTALIDIRGLWYNPRSREIGGNGYAQNGWFNYELNKKGMVEAINIFKKGRYQPDDHSPGVLNTEDNEVLFLNGLNIDCYSTDGVEKRKTIQLYIGKKTPADAGTVSSFENNYNTRSLIYTGRQEAEIGLLNITERQVELYNIKTGYMTKIVKLPLNFKPESFFNFSYCNDVFWVFNKNTRYWLGFKED